jgi:hypothetical protein
LPKSNLLKHFISLSFLKLMNVSKQDESRD